MHTLHAGPRECLDSAAQLAHELSRELRTHVSPGVPRDKRDRWGRLLVSRRSYQGRDGQRIAAQRDRPNLCVRCDVDDADVVAELIGFIGACPRGIEHDVAREVAYWE